MWNFTPAGHGKVFILGNEDSYNAQQGYTGSTVSLRFLDVTDPTKPTLLGAPSTFGEGWAWTPAAGTFKAFTKSDDTDGLVVLPFSGWSANYNAYNNGLQLIEFTPTVVKTSGHANTKVGSSEASSPKGGCCRSATCRWRSSTTPITTIPRSTFELPLARNVIDARPNGGPSRSSRATGGTRTIRPNPSCACSRPIKPKRTRRTPSSPISPIEGVNARVFHNDKLSYVVTSVRNETRASTAARW